MLLIAIAAFAFWRLQAGSRQSATVAGVLLTPIGFPETAQDVGTMEGEPAPAFTLRDETGQTVTEDPAEAEQPIVLVFNMGQGRQICVQQLGELQAFVPELQDYAKVYTINRDPPAQAVQVRQISRTSLPILYDENLEVTRQYDFLPKPGQPMGGMSDIPQMGFVIIDEQGNIRVQRVDIYFGRHGEQIQEIVKSL